MAEWNERAIQFYGRYGFRRTDQYRKGVRGNHILMVEDLGSNGKLKKANGAAGQKGARGGRKGGSTNKKGGFGVKAVMIDSRREAHTIRPSSSVPHMRSSILPYNLGKRRLLTSSAGGLSKLRP